MKLLKKLSIKELVLYIISALIALIGLIFLILGVVADNLSVNDPLYLAQANFPWRYLGFILIGIAVIFAIIVLCVFAKKIDRVADRELRRKQRLSAMMSDIEKEEIVVSEGKIVEEKHEEVKSEPEIEVKPVVNEAKKEEPVINNQTNNPGENK